MPRLIVARGVKLDSGTAVGDFSNASTEPAAIFADRGRYESYLPLYGNVSYQTRYDYWTSAVDPPAASMGTR